MLKRQKKAAPHGRDAERAIQGDMRQALKSHISATQRLSRNGLTSLCCNLSLLSISAAVNLKLDALAAGTDERTV